ncbi:rhomboid family intramembrane serine protease [Xanthobacter autotrophicus]|uniref:rhomboid family intramembrane serine protease n=1 Tax=Xanthobacter TaxID=279 RepID=UPI0024AA3E8B|nr:rhomboid family intramembrane serine protease [Xanthobacter autotrophicus]MDI4663344.1 rhomboid family intramembrane serine protease [Xanthobacter autotrophicus]
MPDRQPIFNVPAAISALALGMVLIHALRVLVLSDEADLEVLTYFAFIPARYSLPDTVFYLPGGFGPKVWTTVSYAVLHANWMHLIVNLVWLLAFGTPVARRFGSARFVAFFAVTAAGGALAHYVSYPDELLPLIGASASVSGAMAAAVRFAFAPGAALSGRRVLFADHQPAGSLLDSLRDRRALVFVGAFFALNLLFAVGVSLPGADGAQIAWQAHVGGFVAGLLLFSLFDPVPRRASRAPSG